MGGVEWIESVHQDIRQVNVILDEIIRQGNVIDCCDIRQGNVI